MQSTSTLTHVTRTFTIKISWAYVLRLFVFFILCLVAAMYLAFAPAVNFKFFNDMVLFQPLKCTSFRPEVIGVTGREVFFRNKFGTKLSGLYFPSSRAGSKTVLVHHGMGHNLNLHAAGFESLAQKGGFSVFIYDYAGFGKSEGSPTVDGITEDARAAREYLLTEMKVHPSDIVHWGGSLGTGPAVILAGEQECAGLILFAPYINLKTVAREAMPYLNYYPDVLVTREDLESLQNIKRVTCPLLLVHGTDDTTIFVYHGDKLFSAAGSKSKTFLRQVGGTHFSSDYQVQAAQFIRSLTIK